MIFIPVGEIRGKNKAALIRFICEYEADCVQLVSLLKKNISNFYAVYINEVNSRNLYGLIGIRKTILHLFPFVKSQVETALQDDFIQSFKDFYLKEKFDFPVCINGQEDGSILLLKSFELMGLKPAQINNYNLLKLEAKSFLQKIKNCPRNLSETTVFRCKKDIPSNYRNQLNELQALYEQEEVVPSCFGFDEDSCRLRFVSALRNQYILALKNKDDEIISKAGTNAIGFKYVQLGGVFTKKEFRGKGYAKVLLINLLVKLLHMRKSVVLFVKIQNLAANKLYDSLAFEKLSDYLIVYFSK